MRGPPRGTMTLALGKRKRDATSLGVHDPCLDSPPHAASVHGDGPRRKKHRLFKRVAGTAARSLFGPPHISASSSCSPSSSRSSSRSSSSSALRPDDMSSELLEFILQHEEAFQSRNRLASLYADFRLQLNTNPEGYYANISVWKKALADAARAGKVPAPGDTHDLLNIRTGEDLARALQHPRYGRPTCLAAVFHDAVAKREFLPLQEFLTAKTSVYSKSWILSPLDVVRWGLRQIGVLGQPQFTDKLGVGNFVVLKNVEAAAEEIQRRMKEQARYTVDRVLSCSDFLARFADALAPGENARLTQRDLDVVLVFLARERQAISFDAHVVKFKAENEAVPAPVTQEDIAIANLRDTMAKINRQLQPLEDRVAELDAKARAYVKQGQTMQAKATLRSKRLADHTLASRTDVALQLEAVYMQLQQAADHVQIVEAMKEGAVALKGLNEKVGGAEGAAAVMDAVHEEMSTADEITQIINSSGETVDEGEIEDEFEALEAAEKEKRERVEAAEREKREQKEAAELAAKFAEADRLERERREKVEERRKELEMSAEATAEAAAEKAVEKDMARLSFQQEPAEGEDQEMEDRDRVPVPA